MPAPTRPPPHDIAAEEALLGAALMSRAALEIVATRTAPGDYYAPGNGHLAAALVDAYANGWTPTVISVADWLDRHRHLDDVGGRDELTRIQNATPTTSVARYAQIVHDHATRRRLIASAEDTARAAYDSVDAHGAVLAAQKAVEGVVANNGARTYSNLIVSNLAALITGGATAVHEPEFLVRADGRGLLYGAAMNMLTGEPTSGKTMLALLAVVQVLAAGGACLYLDFEDTDRGILGRLLALGAMPVDIARFLYTRLDGPFGLAERADVAHHLDTLNPDIIVIDGVAEALARDGYDEDKAKDVVAWVEKLPRWLAQTGACVLMLDHVVKNRENRGRDARGSGHKRAAVTGAMYEAFVTEGFSRHRAGTIKLRIQKDRVGAVGSAGEVAAVARIEPSAAGEVLRITLAAAAELGDTDGGRRPTTVMGHIARELAASTEPITARQLRALIPNHRPRIFESALQMLQREGYVASLRAGRTEKLRLVRPFAGHTPGGQTQTGMFDHLPDDSNIIDLDKWKDDNF